VIKYQPLPSSLLMQHRSTARVTGFFLGRNTFINVSVIMRKKQL